MKWIAIAGAWRTINTDVERDVRAVVRDIFARGDGLVSGGALGVDYVALDEALRLDTKAQKIQIFIPSTLDILRAHFYTRASEGVITQEQADAIVTQLTTLKSKNPKALIEGTDTTLNKETYFNRITKIVEASDELVAFHVNATEGTQDTITKAQAKGIPVQIFPYTIPIG